MTHIKEQNFSYLPLPKSFPRSEVFPRNTQEHQQTSLLQASLGPPSLLFLPAQILSLTYFQPAGR